MLNILSLKKKQNSSSNTKKTTSAEIRIQKDLQELRDLPKSLILSFPDTNNLFLFHLEIVPDEGLYKTGRFKFTIKINPNYPHEPPKVNCTQKIYHPNIDLEGNVCLNILRQDWKPVLNLNSVLIGLQYLFLEPNPDDPLNKDAAKQLLRDRKTFQQKVHESMKGCEVDGTKFDKVIS